MHITFCKLLENSDFAMEGLKSSALSNVTDCVSLIKTIDWGAFASCERKLPSNLQKSAVTTTLGNTLAVFFTLSFERDLIDTSNYDDKINLFN